MTPRSDPSNQRNHFPLTAVILSFDYTRIANWLSVMVCVSKWGAFLKGIVHLHENLSQTNVFVRGIDQSCFSQTIFPWIYKSNLVNTLTNCSLCAIMKKREERKKLFLLIWRFHMQNHANLCIQTTISWMFYVFPHPDEGLLVATHRCAIKWDWF